MTRFRYGTAVIIATAFLIAGCGAEGGSSSGVARDEAASAPRSARPATQASSEAYAGSADEAAGSPEKTTVVPDARAVIYTAQLTVRVKDVPAATDQAKQIVTVAGGYVSEERSNSFSSRDEAVVTFKIPPARYPDVLTQLGRDLGKRESLHQGAQDVTEEVADVASRVKSAESTLDQFRTLLRKANKIGEILEIEREISNREAELESLQARQKALAAQTGMATVTLSLAGPAAPKPKPKPKESGFLAGLHAGWNALVGSVEVGLVVLGVLLPWLVLGAVIGLPLIAITRRRAARRTAEARPLRVPPPGEWQRAEAGARPQAESARQESESGAPRGPEPTPGQESEPDAP
ncbi:DUF4349 domain-containing protein [Microtetraspora malaysiensis]|uniref:DUF4349 domain-containing protein n=1 Tax=Microtetraspora malaysiensis TaxID=161358 RepID=UPI000832213E|nr:DUF4349 domain-containing protein [Microtetraspora malaysiensis]